MKIPALILMAAFMAVLASGCSDSQQGDMASRTTEPENPNVVLILTDDLDTKLLEDNLDSYPNIKEVARNGTTFENAFVSNSLCCPSRATFLTGFYSHNSGVLDNVPPNGGWTAFKPLEEDALPVWLEGTDYRAAYIGKYLNGYDGSQVPAGWDHWEGLVGWRSYAESREIPIYKINENGEISSFRKEDSYHTDLFKNKALDYIRATDQPFYLQIPTSAPHEPAIPADRHKEAFEDLEAPKPPSFNEENVADKPAWIRKRNKLSPKWVNNMDELYRNQAQSMLAVDEMVGSIKEALEEKDELDNTYIFFTSDNGYHRGHHRLRDGKRTAYEEDIRVPLIVQGPGVPEGAIRDEMVLNNDFAPTVAEITGAEPPFGTDGRSLVSLLHGEKTNWRDAFFIQATERERLSRPAYSAVRTGEYTYVEYENGERELYDLEKDPYQLRNFYKRAEPALLETLQQRLETLRNCRGEECGTAEGF